MIGLMRVVWVRDQGGGLIKENRHYTVHLELGGMIRVMDQGGGMVKKTVP